MSEKPVPAFTWRDTWDEAPGVAHLQTDVVAVYRDRVVARLFDIQPGMWVEQGLWTWSVELPPPSGTVGGVSASGCAAARNAAQFHLS